MKKLFSALALAGLLSLSAWAQPNYNVCFTSLDADMDGHISKGEFLVAFSAGDPTVFEQADADKDGKVTHEEWEAYKASRNFE